MKGTLYYFGGQMNAFADDMEKFISANERGLIVCNTGRDANELSRMFPWEKCRFASRHDVGEKILGMDFAWAFVPLGFLDDITLIRIRMRIRIEGFVNPHTIVKST